MGGPAEPISKLQHDIFKFFFEMCVIGHPKPESAIKSLAPIKKKPVKKPVEPEKWKSTNRL